MIIFIRKTFFLQLGIFTSFKTKKKLNCKIKAAFEQSIVVLVDDWRSFKAFKNIILNLKKFGVLKTYNR